MAVGVARWQRFLVSGGDLEPGGARTARDWIVDSAMFAFAVGAGLYVLADTWEQHSSAAAVADILLGCFACAALWLRREHPLAVALLTVALASVSALATMATLPALFSAAIRLPLRPLVATALLALASTAVFPLLYPDIEGRGYGWQITVGVLLTAVAVGWGLFVRAQRALERSLRERAESAARAAERGRIAREMHDVLAHRLSILSVHAGALENAGDAVPPEYVETAGVIRTSARAALEELRQVIGLLRDADAGPVPEPPQPTLAEIPALIEESRRVGLPVHYRDNVATEVPTTIARTAYRAVQEGLTNARKHSAGGAVDVTLDAADGPPLVVELVSRGRPGTGAGLPGTGTGLVGLAERVALAGGDLEHGRDGAGNFVLRATLPWVP
jgi:signal transduction histidine kinase